MSLHRFLLRHAFYPLALSSLLAMSILVSRFKLSQTSGYRFLAWNLFLAWVPYLCSLWISALNAQGGSRWKLLIPGILWLLFFPNAPYILTDFIHYMQIQPLAWWFDLGLILSFAWSGCFLAVASLRILHDLVARACGKFLGWTFVTASIMLCGVGIFIGRFLRWNSWDVFTRYRSVYRDVAAAGADPFGHPVAISVSLMFSAILFVCYLTFYNSSAVDVGPSKPSRRPSKT